MRLVSYAQNFEDVMLWRALKEVRAGCYVDVGAQHPIVDSVSRFFYEQGWRGVHIEPVPEYAALLREDRPDEIVLEAALGASDGELTLNIIPGTGLSTAVDAHAQTHAERQGLQFKVTRVSSFTLASALGFLNGHEVHWLKIDVEGMEIDVLRGWDSTVLRPWIIVVEATLPASEEPSYESWEPILEQAKYRFVYFDGLNRFYIAHEHADLASAFQTPPNVFDGFELSGQASAAWCQSVQKRSCELEGLAARALEELHVKVRQTETLDMELAQDRRQLGRVKAAHAKEMEKLKAAVKAAQCNTDRISAQLQAVYESRTWRMTGWLRKPVHVGKVITKAGLLIAKNPRQGTRQAFRSGLVWAMRGVLARPHIQNRASELLSRYPSVKLRFRLLAIRAGLIGDSQRATVIDNPLSVVVENNEISMPARATAIFGALKQAVKERNQ